MIKTLKLKGKDIPKRLQDIPSPPKELYIHGANINELLKNPVLSVVGSRKATKYGQAVTYELTKSVAKRGVVIVSGMALGIDGIAHNSALDVNAKTIAVLPSGLDKYYPRTHQRLAEKILSRGGAIISEFPEKSEIFNQNFILRNRLIAGLADVLLITEASLKSGSLHTARFALEQGKTVMAVPGNITNPMSVGTNNLIKSGAIVVTEPEDILFAMNINLTKSSKSVTIGQNHEQQVIIDLLEIGVSDGELLFQNSNLEVNIFNQTMTMLEIEGVIKSLGSNQWAKSS